MANDVILDFAQCEASLSHQGDRLKVPLRKERGTTQLTAMETDLLISRR